MWFGNYKVCVSPAFLSYNDSLQIHQSAHMFSLYSLVAVTFLKTIQLDSFSFLFLLWVSLQPIGKVTTPKCSPGFLNGLLSRVWFLCSPAWLLQCSLLGCQWIQQCETLPWDWKPAIVWCNKPKASLYQGCISMAVGCLLNSGWKPIRRFQLNAFWRIHLDKTKIHACHCKEQFSACQTHCASPHQVLLFPPKNNTAFYCYWQNCF